MRRALVGLAAVGLLAGCGGSEPEAAAPISSSAPSETSAAATSMAAPRTTQAPERQEQLFSASMNTLGIVPAVGTIDEMRVAAGEVCVGYGQGVGYLEQMNTLVQLGMSLDQATAFEDATLTIYCPEYLPA